MIFENFAFTDAFTGRHLHNKYHLNVFIRELEELFDSGIIWNTCSSDCLDLNKNIYIATL